jgi:hypothetical protein
MAQGIDPADPRWWTFGVAALALVQPWAIAGYKKWIRRGAVEIYEQGAIEVGFSFAGPTVALLGTLRAIDRDVFIRSIGVEIVRLQDKSHHKFDWLAFRQGRITLSGTQDAALEVPSSFLLTTSQPFRFNVVLGDTTTAAKTNDLIATARTAWNDQLSASGLYIPNPQLSQTEAVSKAINNLRSAYSAGRIANDVYKDIDRQNYWEPGKYRLTFEVNLTHPDRSITKSWQFTLTENDSQLVRANAGAMVASVTGSSVQYNFAYSKYEVDNY